MIHVDFGKLNFKKMEHVIYDLDNCLFPYPEGYAEEFSVQTAKSAIKLARKKILTGGDDNKLLELLEMDFNDLVAMAKKSYADYGCTTKIFEKKYNLHAVKLYQDHHRTIIHDIITPTFQKFARHGLRQGMVMLHNLGVKQHLYTNATEEYAIATTTKLGVKNCLDTHVGIDSYDDIGHPSGDPDKKGKIALFPKYMRWAWHDAIELMQIPTFVSETDKNNGLKPFIIGQNKDPGATYKYWDYSNTVFIDDSPENLKIAKELGMQTVLLKTDRVDYDSETMPYIDTVTDNVDVFLCLMAHEVERLKPSVTGNKLEPTAYSGPRLAVSN